MNEKWCAGICVVVVWQNYSVGAGAEGQNVSSENERSGGRWCNETVCGVNRQITRTKNRVEGCTIKPRKGGKRKSTCGQRAEQTRNACMHSVRVKRKRQCTKSARGGGISSPVQCIERQVVGVVRMAVGVAVATEECVVAAGNGRTAVEKRCACVVCMCVVYVRSSGNGRVWYNAKQR